MGAQPATRGAHARRVRLRRVVAAGTGALLLSARAGAGVILTEKAALERAFPGRQPERRTLYLTADQTAAVQKAARSRLPSPVITVWEARADGAVTGRAYLDTHVVRTMPETVMAVVEPDGRLRMALVLQFNEPDDYLPRERWLTTLSGKALDDDLWPDRGVHRVTGSTLTVQALTEAVRRCLAVDAIVVRGAR